MSSQASCWRMCMCKLHQKKKANQTHKRGPTKSVRGLNIYFGEFSSLLTVKTLTGMTTDVYPRENCIAPAIVFIVWTTNTKK